MGRNALGDADDERDAGRGRFQDGGGCAPGRHRDERGVRPGRRDGLRHRVEHRDALDVLAALAGRDPGHHLGAVGPVAQAVETPLAAGQPLHDHLGLLVDEDAHLASTPASSTALRAASSMVGHDITRSDSTVFRISPPLLGVGAVEADHDRRADLDPVQGLHDAVGHLVALW